MAGEHDPRNEVAKASRGAPSDVEETEQTREQRYGLYVQLISIRYRCYLTHRVADIFDSIDNRRA